MGDIKKMGEYLECDYKEKQELSPQQKALQEMCSNCERWDILKEHACATKCDLFKILKQER